MRPRTRSTRADAELDKQCWVRVRCDVPYFLCACVRCGRVPFFLILSWRPPMFFFQIFSEHWHTVIVRALFLYIFKAFANAVDPLIRDVSFGSRMSTRTVFWQHKWPPGQDFGSKTATRTVLWQQNDHALEPKRIPLFWQQFWQYTWRPELRVGCKDCHQNYNVAARQRPGICFGCRCKAATRTVFG